jgi:hypothetical protein
MEGKAFSGDEDIGINVRNLRPFPPKKKLNKLQYWPAPDARLENAFNPLNYIGDRLWG